MRSAWTLERAPWSSDDPPLYYFEDGTLSPAMTRRELIAKLRAPTPLLSLLMNRELERERDLDRWADDGGR